MKRTFATLAGIVVAVLMIGTVQYISHKLFAPAVMPDMSDPAAVRAFVMSMPIGAFLMVLFSYMLGAFVGGMVAVRVAARVSPHTKPMVCAGIVGGFVLAASLMNVVMIPHPIWFVVALVVAIPASAWLVLRLSSGVPPELSKPI